MSMVASSGTRTAGGPANGPYCVILVNTSQRKIAISEISVSNIPGSTLVCPVGLGFSSTAHTGLLANFNSGAHEEIENFSGTPRGGGLTILTTPTGLTAPAVYIRRAVINGVGGAGITWRFPPGEELIMSPLSSEARGELVLWNFTGTAANAVDVHVECES